VCVCVCVSVCLFVCLFVFEGRAETCSYTALFPNLRVVIGYFFSRNIKDIPEQLNGCDCGVFACKVGLLNSLKVSGNSEQ